MLVRGMDTVREQCRAMDLPTDPFVRDELVGAALRLDAELMMLCQRLGADRRQLADRWRAFETNIPPPEAPGSGCLVAIPRVVASVLRRTIGRNQS